MAKKKLPDGRTIDEPIVELAPPPVGNVNWIAKRKLEVKVNAFTSKEAKRKASEIFNCEVSQILVDVSQILVDVFKPEEWIAKTEVTAIVNAHTFFEAREKAILVLRCDPFHLTLEQAPTSPNGEATEGQDGSKPFNPWASLAKNVKRARKRGVYR